MDYSRFRQSNNIEDLRGQRVDPLQTWLGGVETPVQALGNAAQNKQTRFGVYDDDIQRFADSLRGIPMVDVAQGSNFQSVLSRLLGQR